MCPVVDARVSEENVGTPTKLDVNLRLIGSRHFLNSFQFYAVVYTKINIRTVDILLLIFFLGGLLGIYTSENFGKKVTNFFCLDVN